MNSGTRRLKMVGPAQQTPSDDLQLLAQKIHSNITPASNMSEHPTESLNAQSLCPPTFSATTTAANGAATGGGADESRLLTVHEVACLLRVPASWVYDRVRRRGNSQLPHVKLGKYLRFELATITKFIRDQRSA